YLIIGSVAAIIIVPLLIFKLIGMYGNYVKSRTTLQATIADLELRLSWYKNKQRARVSMFEILQEYPQEQDQDQVKPLRVVKEETVQMDMPDVVIEPVIYEPVVATTPTTGEVSQAFLDLINEGAERKQLEQMEMEL